MGILKKIKKVVKKAAKPAALIGAAYLASKGLGKKYNTSSVSVDSGRGGNSSSARARVAANKIYQDDIMRGGSGVKADPDKNWYQKIKDAPWPRMAEGGRATYKSGGAALRGVSPILMKGKK